MTPGKHFLLLLQQFQRFAGDHIGLREDGDGRLLNNLRLRVTGRFKRKIGVGQRGVGRIELLDLAGNQGAHAGEAIADRANLAAPRADLIERRIDGGQCAGDFRIRANR